MELEIDVSGEDILSKNYTICIADKNNLIKGFKFSDEIAKTISSRYGQNFYKYSKSKKGKALLKIRIYSIIIYYLIKNSKIDSKLKLKICRDFDGRENEIINNLNYFINKKLGLNFDFEFTRLGKNSPAHQYSYLMRKDNKNKMKTYINISLNQIEKFLRK